MSPLRQWLGRIGLGFALIVIVSPAVLFFLWMLSLSVKFEVDNASYPPVFIPEHFNWGNYAAVFRSNRFSTYFMNSLIVTGAATAFALLVGVPAGYGLAPIIASRLLPFKPRSATLRTWELVRRTSTPASTWGGSRGTIRR